MIKNKIKSISQFNSYKLIPVLRRHMRVVCEHHGLELDQFIEIESTQQYPFMYKGKVYFAKKYYYFFKPVV
ncbi:MAG: hypothetical protein ACRCX2_10580 [Paraclostridium sp.]